MQEIVVPIDDSDASWTAATVGCRLAEVLGADLTLLTVETTGTDGRNARTALERGLARLEPADGSAVHRVVQLATTSVAGEIQRYVDDHPGSVVVMATHGRGRSSAITGSIADDVLRRTFGPVLLVGPRVESARFDGPVVITVDGSELSERAVPLGVSWAIELGVAPWIVHCSTADQRLPHDVGESTYVAGLARTFTASSGHEVEFEELHGRHPETVVPDFAGRRGASIIVAASHGRTGLSRLTLGSVASGFVRHASCPILVMRPPELRADSDEASSTSAATATGG